MRTWIRRSVVLAGFLVILSVVLYAQTAQYTKLRLTSQADDTFCVGHDSQSPTAAQCNGGVYAGGSALISAAGVLGVSGLGVHTFSAGAASPSTNVIRLVHTTAGAGNSALVQVGNDTNVSLLTLAAYSSTFTTSNQNLAGGGKIQSEEVGGLSIAATHASGDIRFYAGGTTEVGRIDSQAWFINDTANANNVRGLTINQLGSGEHILTLKSSDVATGLTTAGITVETDDFAILRKVGALTGGLVIEALGENAAVTQNFMLSSFGGQAGTTHSIVGRALFEFYAAQHDGAGTLANITADGLVAAFRGRVGGSDTTLWLVDEDGDTWQNGGITATTGAFSSTVSMTGLTATTGAFSSTVSMTGLTATTGAFSSTVSMTGLTATTGAFSSTVSMTGLTATTGAFSDGTAGAPSITFSGETTKGFYSGGAGVIDTAFAGVVAYSMSATAFQATNRALGTGNVTGRQLMAGRNTSGSGAAGVINIFQLDGGANYLWADNSADPGMLRISTAAPDEDGTPSDTSGTIVGTQTSTLDTKTLLPANEGVTPQQALVILLRTPVVPFYYRGLAYNGTKFQGIVTDWSPEFGMDPDASHPNGRSFNPVSAFGYTVQSFKALHAELEALREEVRELRSRR